MTLAVAQVASDRCPDILVNTEMLGGLRARLHIQPDDDMAAQIEVRAIIKKLHDAIAEAPSPRAWCDATYRLYGPDGQIRAGLLAR